MNKKNTTLITGAAGFLGQHHSNTIMEMGNSLVIVDKNKKELFKLSNKLKKKFKNKNIIPFVLDITNEKKVFALSKNLKKKKIFISSIINNAAIDAIPSKKKNFWSLVSTDQWKKELDTSLLGSYLIIKYFVQDMCKAKNGIVINIGSDLSVIAPNQQIYKNVFGNYIKPVTYSVVKHGLLGMTKYFSSLFARYNVRFNMISPGPVYNKQNKRFVKELNKVIPMGRMGTTKDLKEIIKFLLNDGASYITGQNIIIDGGRTII